MPLLPILVVQALWVKRTVPRLPEPPDIEGFTGDVQRAFRFLAIGESTVSGVGVDSHNIGLAGYLGIYFSEALQRKVLWCVAAKSGYNTAKVTQEVLPTAPDGPFDLLVLGIGGNNAFELHTPWRFKKEAEALIAACIQRYPDTPILFINMPPVHEFPAFPQPFRWFMGSLVDVMGEQLAAIVQQHNNVWFYNDDLFSAEWADGLKLDYHRNDFFSDGVHPSELTYKLWAEALVRYAKNQKIV